MGTSKPYGGPSSGLIPSWLDDPSADVAPVSMSPMSGPTEVGPSQTAPISSTDPSALVVPPPSSSPPTSMPVGGGSFSSARRSYSQFCRTGNRRALRRALSSYVRNGTGGSRRAARRMGASKTVAAALLGIARDVQLVGASEALRVRNVLTPPSQPATDVFTSLVEKFCPSDGSIDSAIARRALLETIGDMAEAGVGNFDTLTPEQLKEFVLDFIARSIEGRIIADIARRGIMLPEDIAAVERVQEQLHDFVAGCVRGELSEHVDGHQNLAENEVQLVADRIYEHAFELISAAAEAEE